VYVLILEGKCPRLIDYAERSIVPQGESGMLAPESPTVSVVVVQPDGRFEAGDALQDAEISNKSEVTHAGLSQ
jgi:hypothetical protein